MYHAEANNVDASSSFITALHTCPGAIRNFPELLSYPAMRGKKKKKKSSTRPKSCKFKCLPVMMQQVFLGLLRADTQSFQKKKKMHV